MEAFLITFRESLEAALIIGILFSLLKALKKTEFNKYITLGVLAGILGSLIFAYIFMNFLGGFEGKSEKIYEGILMFLAAGLITHMVFWMKSHARFIKKNMTVKIKKSLQHKSILPIFLLAFFSVIREGVETVVFFQAIDVQSNGGISVIAGIMGILVAIGLALFLNQFSRKISFEKFFKYTGILLIFIAGGLLAHGIVEFQGAGIFPTYLKPVYDLSGILSEKNGIGSFMKALFGYDANPSFLAILGYISFLVLSFFSFRKK